MAALAVAYVKVSPWTLPLFFIPGLAAQRLFGLYQEQRHLASQLAVANTDLEKANLSFATALVTTLDAPGIATPRAIQPQSRSTCTWTSRSRMGLAEEEVGKGPTSLDLCTTLERSVALRVCFGKVAAR